MTYAAKIDKAEARVDWRRPAAEVDRLIRGLAPFPGAWTGIGGERVKLMLSEIGRGRGRARGRCWTAGWRWPAARGRCGSWRCSGRAAACRGRPTFLRGRPVAGGAAARLTARRRLRESGSP